MEKIAPRLRRNLGECDSSPPQLLQESRLVNLNRCRPLFASVSFTLPNNARPVEVTEDLKVVIPSPSAGGARSIGLRGRPTESINVR